MRDIIVYTRENCPQCLLTKRFLYENSIDFEERNINENPEYISWLKAQGFQSVPVLFIEENNTTIIGFQPDRLKELIS